LSMAPSREPASSNTIRVNEAFPSQADRSSNSQSGFRRIRRNARGEHRSHVRCRSK
jgi:hypothetical protein